MTQVLSKDVEASRLASAGCQTTLQDRHSCGVSGSDCHKLYIQQVATRSLEASRDWHWVGAKQPEYTAAVGWAELGDIW